MKRLFNSKAIAFVLVLALVFAMTSVSFAGSPTTLPPVTVTVTYGNFTTQGAFSGQGFPDLNVNISGTAIEIDTVQFYIDDSFFNLKATYLPSTVPDPMNGDPSVLDAIITAVWENYGKGDFDEVTGEIIPGTETVNGGWDSWTTPNGGYISNIVNYALVYNPTTYFEGANGNKWGHSTGTGWNIAYQPAGGTVTVPALYASNIPLAVGMNIIYDVSPYDMTWDTGEPWTGEE